VPCIINYYSCYLPLASDHLAAGHKEAATPRPSQKPFILFWSFNMVGGYLWDFGLVFNQRM